VTEKKKKVKEGVGFNWWGNRRGGKKNSCLAWKFSKNKRNKKTKKKKKKIHSPTSIKNHTAKKIHGQRAKADRRSLSGQGKTQLSDRPNKRSVVTDEILPRGRSALKRG